MKHTRKVVRVTFSGSETLAWGRWMIVGFQLWSAGMERVRFCLKKKHENRGETKKILNIQAGWWKWTVMLTDNPQRPWSHYKLCLSPLLLLCFQIVFNYVSPEANYTNRHKQKYIFFLSDSQQQPFKPTDYMNLSNMSCQHNLQPKS